MSPSRTSTSPSRRSYSSPLREQRAAETRANLLRVATAMFSEKGWAGTGMRDIAREAGVAVETLYSHFPSKRELIRVVLDQAVVGDDAGVAVAERPEFLALGRGRRPDRVGAAAALVRAINERVAPFEVLLRDAAATDADVAAMLRATYERRRADVSAGIGLVLGREPTDDERDGVWAILSPEVHRLLVIESGWSHDRYQRWIAATLSRVLPRS